MGLFYGAVCAEVAHAVQLGFSVARSKSNYPLLLKVACAYFPSLLDACVCNFSYFGFLYMDFIYR